MKKVRSLDELQSMLTNNSVILLYVSTSNCSVCIADKPRANCLANELAIPIMEVNAIETPAVRGQFNLFTAPVIILFFNGREIYRTARIIDFQELAYRIKQVKDSLL